MVIYLLLIDNYDSEQCSNETKPLQIVGLADL